MTREYALKNIRHNVGTYVEMEFFINEIYDDFEAQQKPKKPKNLQEVIIAEKLPEYTNININAFNEWMAYKKYKNKGAITKTLNMLNKYDFQTQQEMVDKSIMNEYKGLFEPKQKRNNTQQNVNVAKSWLEDNQTQEVFGIDVVEDDSLPVGTMKMKVIGG